MIRLLNILKEVQTETKIKAIEAKLGRSLTEAELEELNLKRAALAGLTAATLGLGGLKGQAQTPKEPTPIVQQATSKISTQDKQDWDKFQKWLEDNDYAGDTQMDKDAFRKNVLSQYEKQNPGTKVTDTNFVKKIQDYMINYRNSLIAKDKKGEVDLAKGKYRQSGNYDDFMPAVLKMDKTGTDGKIGQFTSQWTFKDYLMKGDDGGLKRISYAPDINK